MDRVTFINRLLSLYARRQIDICYTYIFPSTEGLYLRSYTHDNDRHISLWDFTKNTCSMNSDKRFLHKWITYDLALQFIEEHLSDDREDTNE